MRDRSLRKGATDERAGESLNDFEFAEREAIGKVRVSSAGAGTGVPARGKGAVGATFQLSPILGFRPPHRDTGFHAVEVPIPGLHGRAREHRPKLHLGPGKRTKRKSAFES
jgi:hypothetical protein